jgi:hypothetical protein
VNDNATVPDAAISAMVSAEVARVEAELQPRIADLRKRVAVLLINGQELEPEQQTEMLVKLGGVDAIVAKGVRR